VTAQVDAYGRLSGVTGGFRASKVKAIVLFPCVEDEALPKLVVPSAKPFAHFPGVDAKRLMNLLDSHRAAIF
jgi:hypothetical protein